MNDQDEEEIEKENSSGHDFVNELEDEEHDEFDDFQEGPGLVEKLKDTKLYSKFAEFKDARTDKKSSEDIDDSDKGGFME